MIFNPCPIYHGQECRDDEQCDRCLEFMTTCDDCLDAGHTESAGWFLTSNGKLLCTHCHDKVIE